MATTDNKVTFNLKNVYYAVYDSTLGTFGTPVHVPGAVSLSLDPQGDTKTFYADGMKYYVSTANNGYSGDLEMALIPADMRKALWGITEDATAHVLVESSLVEPSEFALLFQVDGDQLADLSVLYRCKATRPSISSKTNEDGKEVQTQKCKVDVSPMEDGKVQATTTPETTEAVRTDWFKSVWLPTVTP